ncbi:hypothetical protein [Rossellomorea aquimaris]|uniref:Uncharacterized protein n=1 Tax=Rossellomorea aquimaris TaxID=189382 RepID=A0A1J6WWF8_9BACI|nr:hypothetical protein [Rossellomorea aquimaris]OIU70233.1 hypothetical protein BHE18_10915 [Rossellomorea aquimaris]
MIELMLLALSIAAVFILYRKSDEEVPYLLAKLIGYTILGTAMFNLNGIRIPAGFIIFLLFFRKIPVNAWSKRRAAYTGFAVFLLSVILSFSVKEWYEWPRKVALKETNFYDGSLLEEWNNIKEKLDVESDYGVKLTDIRMVIDKAGNYESLDLSIVEDGPPETVYYRIRLSEDGETVDVKRTKRDAEDWGQTPYSEADFVFSQLDLITKPMLNHDSVNYYELNSDGQRMGYAVKDQKNYRVDTAGKKELKDSELPVDGIAVGVCGTEGGIDEHGMILECDNFEHYLFDVLKNKPELNTSSVLETAESISPQVAGWLSEHIGDNIGSEKNGEFILKIDGKEKRVSEQEYIKALKETPYVEVIEQGQDNWKVKVENPYGNPPHTMEFELTREGPEVVDLHFR